MMYKGNLIKDTVLLMTTRMLTIIVNLAQTMILSRQLTKDEYGTFSQGVLIITLGTQLLSLGLENGVTFFFNRAQNDFERKKYVGVIFKISILLNVIGGVLLLVLNKQIIRYFNNPLLYGCMVYIIFRPLLSNVISLYNSLFVSCGMASNNAIRNMFFALLRVFLLPIILTYECDIEAVFILLLLLDVIQVIYLIIKFSKTNFLINIFCHSNHLIRDIVIYSLPLLLNTLVASLSKEMDKLIVGRMFNVEEFAVYSNMSKELPFSFFAFTLSSLLLPVLVQKIVSKKEADAIQIWKNYLGLGILFTGITVTASLLNSRELLLLLYSDKYIEGLQIFQIYLVMEYFRFSYFGIILSAYGKNIDILLCSLGALFSNAILNVIFIKIIGLTGPAIASVLTVFISNLAQFLKSIKMLRIELKNFINVKKIAIFILELLIVSALLICIKKMILENTVNYIFNMTISYLCFFVILGLMQHKNIKNLVKRLNKAP